MSENERVKILRQELGLNQNEFGEKLKIGQRAIGHIETGKNGLTERNFESICRVFNVNPLWLKTGEGEMFNLPSEKDFLDTLAEKKGLNPEEKALIGSIIDLPRPARKAVIDWAFKLVTAIEAQTSDIETATRIRELEESIASQQKELAELKGGVAPYVEDTSIETG